AERQTIRGTLAGVTVVGETMVNYETNRAAVAQMSYLTILGSPRRGDAHHGEQGAAHQKSSEAKEDSSAEGKDNKSGEGSQGDAGSAQRRRANVYLVAITPRTKVRAASGSGDDSSGAKSSASRDAQGQSLTTFERLELGDRVEVEFKSEGATSQKSMGRKHGRHRTFRGVATSITILPEEEGDDRHGSSSSSKQDDESSKQDDESSKPNEKK
ncbi:MAG: hypothetical protein WKF75_15790, partial [Singulisphaera sp.]